jgi:hypothetical protein
MSAFNEKDQKFGEGGFQPDGDMGGSRRGSVTVQGRKMSRIGPTPRLGSKAGAVDADEGDVQARLIAMEADNAIQYRTCSWQKVSNS